MKFDCVITDDAVKKALGLSCKTRTTTMSDGIIEIFKAAKVKGRDELSVNDITAAYYKMVTQPTNGPLKAKNCIAQQLCNMHKKGIIEPVPGKRGMYRLK